MKRPFVKYLLIFLAQAALWNYFNFSQYVILVFLPAIILCLPMSYSTVRLMVTAFLTGLVLDFIVTGQLGLTSLALVPVALLRRPVVRLCFGPELLSRGEELSFQRLGLHKFVPAILLMTALFLLIYLPVDSAGTRPFQFEVLRLLASLAVSTLVSLSVAYLILDVS